MAANHSFLGEEVPVLYLTTGATGSSLETWQEHWLHGALRDKPLSMDQPRLAFTDIQIVYEAGSSKVSEDPGHWLLGTSMTCRKCIHLGEKDLTYGYTDGKIGDHFYGVSRDDH